MPNQQQQQVKLAGTAKSPAVQDMAVLPNRSFFRKLYIKWRAYRRVTARLSDGRWLALRIWRDGKTIRVEKLVSVGIGKDGYGVMQPSERIFNPTLEPDLNAVGAMQ